MSTRKKTQPRRWASSRPQRSNQPHLHSASANEHNQNIFLFTQQLPNTQNDVYRKWDMSKLKVVIVLPSAVSLTCTWQSIYKWRVDLSKSEKYWDGWFRGTSSLFLACNLPKLLLLAGEDSLLLRLHQLASQAWLTLCKCASRNRPTGQRPDHWPNARWAAVTARAHANLWALVTWTWEDGEEWGFWWLRFLIWCWCCFHPEVPRSPSVKAAHVCAAWSTDCSTDCMKAGVIQGCVTGCFIINASLSTVSEDFIKIPPDVFQLFCEQTNKRWLSHDLLAEVNTNETREQGSIFTSSSATTDRQRCGSGNPCSRGRKLEYVSRPFPLRNIFIQFPRKQERETVAISEQSP